MKQLASKRNVEHLIVNASTEGIVYIWESCGRSKKFKYVLPPLGQETVGVAFALPDSNWSSLMQCSCYQVQEMNHG
jgi:hypothetical protein